MMLENISKYEKLLGELEKYNNQLENKLSLSEFTKTREMSNSIKEIISNFKKNNPFVVDFVDNIICKNPQPSPRILRKEYPFDFKIWLQEEYERMMQGKRSPLILGESSMTEQEKEANTQKNRIIGEFEKIIEDSCNIASKRRLSPLKKIFTINKEFPELFSNKNQKHPSIYYAISLELFTTLIRISHETPKKKTRYNIQNNVFLFTFQKRLQKIIVDTIKTLNNKKEEDNEIKIWGYKNSIIKQILNDYGLAKKNQQQNYLQLAYDIFSILIVKGYLKPEVANIDDVENILEDGGDDWFGSFPNMTSFTSKFIPENMNEAIFNEIKRTRAHFMYCPPKKHRKKKKINDLKLNKTLPKDNILWKNFSYLGGNLTKESQISILNSPEWNNFISDESLNIVEQKCELKPLTLNCLNILQETQWEINLDFLREIAMFEGETEEDTKTPFKKLKIKSSKLKFLTWLEDEFKKQIQERSASNNKSYKNKSKQSKKNVWDIILGDASKAIRNTGNVFWHPWAVDSRTRLYPVNPLLSPIGDDFSKAMIRFKEWKPLTLEGFKWFKIHLYNLFTKIEPSDFITKPGSKKPFEDRVKWVDKNKKKLLKIAANPRNYKNLLGFENNIFSKKEVFSRLAMLIEFKRILEELDNKKKEMSIEDALNNIKSGIPIYLDASNNGFQHMAAFLLNEPLAKKVNLMNSTTPEDLYDDISKKCKEKIVQEEFKEQLKELGLNKKEIKAWKCIFSRDFVKNPTMVKSYGGSCEDAIIGKPNTTRKKGRKKPRDGYYFDGSKKLIDGLTKEELKKIKEETIHKQSPFYEVLKANQDLPNIKNFFLEYDTSKRITRRWHINDNEKNYKSSVEKLNNSIKLARIISDITEKSIIEITEEANGKIKKIINKILPHPCKKIHPGKSHDNWEENNPNYGINKAYIEWQALPPPSEKESSIIRNIYPYYDTRKTKISAGYFSIELPHDIIEKPNNTELAISTIMASSYSDRYKIVNYYLNEVKKSFILDLPDEEGKAKQHQELIEGFEKEAKEYLGNLTKEKRKEEDTWSSLQCRERRDWRNKVINKICENYLDADENKTFTSLLFILLSTISNTITYPIEKNKAEKNHIEFKTYHLGYHQGQNKSSLPPNIIHSFDATHMQLIITKFYKKGEREDFWAVHDCFGTHASDVEKLRKIIKDTFIELYNDLNLKTFIEQIIENENNKFGSKIKKRPKEKIYENAKDFLGDLDINTIKHAKYMIG